MKITYAEGVFEELVNLSGYLADESETIAQSFLDACDETFRFLASNPHAGAVRRFHNRNLSNVRMWRVRNFEKYLIFYIVTETAIKVLHVIHSARDYDRIFESD
jgi:toxin ParE1/3/4